jgi:hypothetical protein
MVKIPLPVDMAYANQHGGDVFSKLTNGNLTDVYTWWNPPVKPVRLGYDLIDFSSFIVRQIKIYVNNGNPSDLKFFIERKDTKAIVQVAAFTGGMWRPDDPWFVLDVSSDLQVNASKFFLQTNIAGSDFPAEMEIWGDYAMSATVLPAAVKTSLKELVGVVTKPWDIDYKMYPEKRGMMNGLKVFRTRMYGDHQTNHNADNSWNLNGFNQVDSMKMLKADGIAVQFCYHALPDNYPWPVSNKDMPSSYLQLAQDVYYFCKQSKDNGNYIDIFELLNEEDFWYGNPKYAHNGYQIAAMCSICFDGHKGQFAGVGVKASGANILFSCGGVAESEPYLLYQMMEWCRTNRGLNPDGTINMCFDIYSFHCYNSLAGQWAFNNPGGVPPELGAAPYFRKLNKIRRANIPGIRLHVGEWSGGDINQGSPLSATTFGSYTAHQVSAMWTVRDMLAQAEHEINANSYYRITQDLAGDPPNSVYDNSAQQFDTMALIRQETWGEKQPDGSYINFGFHRVLTGDYVRQISDVLFGAGYVFDSRLSGNIDKPVAEPNVVKFKKTDGPDLYVIWQHESMQVNTDIGGDRPKFTERIGTYTLNVKGKLRKFVDDGSGVMTSSDFAGGIVQFSSKPVIVIADGTVTPPIPPIDPPIPPDPPPVIVTWNQVDRGYWKDKATGKNKYFLLYENNIGKLAAIRCSSTYKPIDPIPTK